MIVENKKYYVPEPSYWPVIASSALFLMAGGFAMMLNKMATGKPLMIAGALILAYLLYGWFSEVVRESVGGLLNKQVNKSFRWGMGWFIYSEVIFWCLVLHSKCFTAVAWRS